MTPLSGEPTPDMEEVNRAEYLTLEQIEQLEQVPAINRDIASRVPSQERCLLAPQELPHLNGKLPVLCWIVSMPRYFSGYSGNC